MHIQDQKKFINIYKLYRNEGGRRGLSIYINYTEMREEK